MKVKLEDDGEDNSELIEEIEDSFIEEYIPLPGQYEINEYRIIDLANAQDIWEDKIFQYRIRTIICSIYNFSTDYRSEWKMHLSISGFGMYCTGNRKAGSSMSDHVRKWDQAVGKTNFGRLCVVEGKPVRITGNRKRA